MKIKRKKVVDTSKVSDADRLTLTISWYSPAPIRIIAFPVSGLGGYQDRRQTIEKIWLLPTGTTQHVGRL